MFERKYILFLVIFIFIFSSGCESYTGEVVKQNFTKSNAFVYFFWGEGCPHCAKEKIFLEKLKEKYPEVKIEMFEIYYNKENAKFFVELSKAYGINAMGVPTTFIGEFDPIIGYNSDETTGVDIEEKIKYCLEKGCVSPISKLEVVNNEKS